MTNQLLGLGIATCVGLITSGMQISLALPPPEDIPEEILRTEIITEGRSPIDGEPLSAAEYAELQAKLAESAFDPDLSPKIKQLIFLLRIRKLLTGLNPL